MPGIKPGTPPNEKQAPSSPLSSLSPSLQSSVLLESKLVLILTLADLHLRNPLNRFLRPAALSLEPCVEVCWHSGSQNADTRFSLWGLKAGATGAVWGDLPSPP